MTRDARVTLADRVPDEKVQGYLDGRCPENDEKEGGS